MWGWENLFYFFPHSQWILSNSFVVQYTTYSNSGLLQLLKWQKNQFLLYRVFCFYLFYGEHKLELLFLHNRRGKKRTLFFFLMTTVKSENLESTCFITIREWFLEKAMALHSSTLACKIPWMEEPGRLRSMRLLGVGHDWRTSLSLFTFMHSLFTFMHWRRKWQPTPVFLPGESQGRGSLMGCRLWSHTESETTRVT